MKAQRYGFRKLQRPVMPPPPNGASAGHPPTPTTSHHQAVPNRAAIPVGASPSAARTHSVADRLFGLQPIDRWLAPCGSSAASNRDP